MRQSLVRFNRKSDSEISLIVERMEQIAAGFNVVGLFLKSPLDVIRNELHREGPVAEAGVCEDARRGL